MQAATDRKPGSRLLKELPNVARRLGTTVGSLRRLILRTAAAQRGHRIAAKDRREVLADYLISYLIRLDMVAYDEI